jgi:tetratricopeptide (TPR) repeat protein
MNCKEIADAGLLLEYVDGRLPGDIAEAMQSHLDICSTCREEEIRLLSLISEIGTLPFEVAPSEEAAFLAGQCTTQTDTPKEITDTYICALRIALARRDFSAAQRLVDFHFDTLMTLEPNLKNAARLLALFARWMDMGYVHLVIGETEPSISLLEMLKNGLQRMPPAPRPLLCLQDVLHLRMASGYVALAEYRHDDALSDFNLVVANFPELGDREMAALAQYGIAKVFRRRGDYDNAGPHVREAIRLASEAGRAEMAAGFSILHAWLHFQSGDLTGAKELLSKAEAVLRRTADHLRLGNIQSVLGRIARREGRYHEASRCFGLALSEYMKWSPKHANNARTLVNRAFVNRLLALKAIKGGQGYAGEESVAKELRGSAHADLSKAWHIYSDLNHTRGQADAKVVAALLYFDTHDFDRAECEAEEGYQLGIVRTNMIVTARARIVECMIENARAANAAQQPYRLDACLERALTCADEAIVLATKTQNKRLQARAHIWRGLTLLERGGVNSLESATECLNLGRSLLGPPGDGYAAEELSDLELKLESRRGSAQLNLVRTQKRRLYEC